MPPETIKVQRRSRTLFCVKTVLAFVLPEFERDDYINMKVTKAFKSLYNERFSLRRTVVIEIHMRFVNIIIESQLMKTENSAALQFVSNSWKRRLTLIL